MNDYNFSKVEGSTRDGHKHVTLDGKVVGEVWREQTHVVVSRLTEPRRTKLKWRWFSKLQGDPRIFGRGTRASMIMGAGFVSRAEALGEMTKAIAGSGATDSTGISETPAE